MAATYNSSTTPRDRARRLLGDTGADGGVFLLMDAELDAELSTCRYNAAVANLADALATRFAQYPDETKTVGGTGIKWTVRVSAWQSLAARLRATSGSSGRGSHLGQLRHPREPRLR